MFNSKKRKLKRPMLFETDDFVELEAHYCERLGTITDNGAYAMASGKYKDLRAEITKDFVYDEEVLRFRRLHPKDWEKRTKKSQPTKAVEKIEEPKPVEPIQPSTSPQVDIITHALLTSPTETEEDADGADEE